MHNNTTELKREVIFQQEFLGSFQFFRDEWLWHPRKDSDGRGPGVNTTAQRVSSEYQKGYRSKYISLMGTDIQTSGWKDTDFYIHFILRVIVSFEKSAKPLNGSRDVDDVERVAKGIHWILSAVISWYNPTRQAVMAQQIEEKLEPSMHTAQSSRLKSRTGITSSVSPKFVIRSDRIIFGIRNSFKRVDASEMIAHQNEMPANKSWLEGKTEDERCRSLQGLVQRLAPEEKNLFDTLVALNAASKPTRIALSRSDSTLCEAGMRQQRLLLAKRFDAELQEDADDDVKTSSLLAYVKVSEEEKARQLDTFRFVDGHSSTGLTLEQAKRDLNINVKDQFPRISGMRFSSSRYLKDYQVEGVAWIVRKLSSMRGCILADAMGLGKTCQAICALFVLAERQMNSDGATRNKPSLIVCPADLIHEWHRELEALLPSYFTIHVYDSSTKAAEFLEQDSCLLAQDDRAPTTVILSTYGVMQRRHGRKRYEKDPDSRKPALFRDWKFCLQDKFSLLIMDEAHSIKGGPKSACWVTITELQADMVMAVTATPVPNTPMDSMGVVPAVVKQTPLEHLNYQGTVNPYDFPDDHPAVLLQCHTNAIHDYIKNENDQTAQGARLKKLFRHILLSRQYTSVVNGRSIGEYMPPIKLETVVLRGAEAQDEELQSIMTNLRDRLLTGIKAGPSMAFIPRAVRTASHAGFWFPFAAMADWDGCKTIQAIRRSFNGVPAKRHLRQVLNYIHEKNAGILGFDPADTDDDLELVRRVVAKSPKLQFTIEDAAIMVLVLRKKLVYWVTWPWVQLMTEVVLKACGFAANAYHAGMTRRERASLIKSFNEADNPTILICSYDIGSEGLNLHKQCADVRCLQPATTVSRESQAIFRIRRIAQTQEQSCARVHLRRCMDFSLLFFNLQKDFPQVFAFINEKRESEARLEANNDDLTMAEQSERTRLYLKVMAGLDENEEFQSLHHTPSTSRSTTPSNSPVPKLPQTPA